MHEERNQLIIDAIIEKAERNFPGTLALIGVYGSYLTGDIHEKSDLDLMIVINDERGWQLGCGFIQDDLNVGHDIYCTTWESLENDARYAHPNIAKLMDSRIVYFSDEKYVERLNGLRRNVRDKLMQPLRSDDIASARAQLGYAEHAFSMALASGEMPIMRAHTGGMIYYVENAITMLNKSYFRFGVRRAYAELGSMNMRPKNFCDMIEAVVAADTRPALRDALIALMAAVQQTFSEAENKLSGGGERNMDIAGTYEEMFSNWRNKMYLAAELSDRHMAFMCMCSLQAMMDDIREEHDIGRYDVMAGYDPEDLHKTAQAFDALLESYRKEYDKAGIKVRRYADIYEFARAYEERTV